jgi:hypothetical protein
LLSLRLCWQHQFTPLTVIMAVALVAVMAVVDMAVAGDVVAAGWFLR